MENLIKTEEAANILGIKKNTLEIWRCKGCGPVFIKIGNSVRYKKDDLENFIKKNTRENTCY